MLFSLVSLLSLTIPLTSAASHSQHLNRHHDIAKRASGAVQLHKRFDGAKWTFYDVGLGACGKYNVESDFIVALNSQQYGGGYPGPNCFKTITMSYKGKTTQAVIMDECPGCPFGGLDLSRSLFRFFANEDEGIIFGTWSFGGGGGGGGGDDDDKDDKPTTTKKPKPTTTKHTPTPTPTPKETPTTHEEPTTTTSSKKKSSTTSRASTSSTPSSTSSSTASSLSSINYSSGAASGLAVPTGVVESGNGQNLLAFNEAIINMGGLASAGADITN